MGRLKMREYLMPKLVKPDDEKELVIAGVPGSRRPAAQGFDQNKKPKT